MILSVVGIVIRSTDLLFCFFCVAWSFGAGKHLSQNTESNHTAFWFTTLYNSITKFLFSSEDEIDIILNGTPEQRRHLHHNNQRLKHGRRQNKRQPCTNDFSSSEDEFEREMNAELDKTVRLLEKARGKWLIYIPFEVDF